MMSEPKVQSYADLAKEDNDQDSLPKPLMIHDWYAWCGVLHAL